MKITGKTRLLSLLLALALLLGGCTPAARTDGTTTAARTSGTEGGAEADTAPAESALPSEAELAALVDAAPITESTHLRDEDYLAYFKTHALSLEQITLHMEDRIYEEARLRSCAKLLLAELTAAEAVLGAKPGRLEVYLVGEVLGGYALNVGAQVYCSVEELEGGSCRDVLLGAAYGIDAAWQRAGLAEYLYGAADDEALRTYYADESRMRTASCSPIFLSPLISDEATVRAARNTARSLCAFLLEREGFAVFCETVDPGPLLPAWQARIGITVPLTLPEKSEVAARMKLETNHNSLCLIKLDNLSFAFKDEKWLKYPDGLYVWFCMFFSGMELTLDRIRAEAPSWAALAEERFEAPIWFSVEHNPYGVSWASEENSVLLTNPTVAWHETVHILLERRGISRELVWEMEAIAEHFSAPGTAPYMGDGFKDLDEYLSWFFEGQGEMQGDDLIFYQELARIYESLREKKDGDFEAEAFERAYGIGTLLLDDSLSRSDPFRIWTSTVGGLIGRKAGDKATNGDDLSYPEATVLFEYLAERFGMDEVMTAYMDGKTLKEAFGIDYRTLYADAVAHYSALYSED